MSGVTVNLPHSPKWSKQWIEKKLSERYFKKPYDRFMWWRSYTPKNKPLTNRHPLRDRIANGDLSVDIQFANSASDFEYTSVDTNSAPTWMKIATDNTGAGNGASKPDWTNGWTK